MGRPLGKNQSWLLRQLANPWLILIVGDREARSLAKRGLLKAHGAGGDSHYQITPDGLRLVADEMEAGTMVFPPPTHKCGHGLTSVKGTPE